MPRLFILLLLVLTFFQLALAGLPMTVIPTMTTAQVDFNGHVEDRPGRCLTETEASGPGQAAASDLSQCCVLCSICQLCHEAAILDGQSLWGTIGPLPYSFLPLVNNYASTDHTPSLKPPIR